MASSNVLCTIAITVAKTSPGGFALSVLCAKILIFALSASLLELKLPLTKAIIHTGLWLVNYILASITLLRFYYYLSTNLEVVVFFFLLDIMLMISES